MKMPLLLLTTALIGTIVHLVGEAEAAVASETAEEEQILKKANISLDGPGLLEFFRRQTPTAADLEQIAGLINQLGDNKFRVRENATRDLIAWGQAALPALRNAAKHEDAEVWRRAAECIEAIERGNEPSVIVAVLRLIQVRKPTGASTILLGYLPLVKDETVEEELLLALVATSVIGDKVEAGIARALDDKAISRKAAAALILGRYGTPEQKTGVRKLLIEGDAKVRLRAAQGLLASRDKAAVPTLVSLLAESSLDVAQAADALLGRLAGPGAPTLALGDKNEERGKYREAWNNWWKANEAKIDLAKANIDLICNNYPHLAREVAGKFLDALTKQDRATFKRLTNLPFYFSEGKTLTTWEELDGLLKEFGPGRKFAFKIGQIVSVNEYLRGSVFEDRLDPVVDNEKAFLRKMRQPDLRAVYISVTEGNGQEQGALFVNLAGGRARVVGIGTGQPPKK